MWKSRILCSGLLCAIGVTATVNSMNFSMPVSIWPYVWFSPNGMVNRTLPFAGALLASVFLYLGKKRSTSLAVFVLLAIISKSIYNIVTADSKSPNSMAINQAIEPVFLLSIAALALLLMSAVAHNNNNKA